MVASTRALRLHEHGRPPVVEDVALPDPGPDEALVVLEHAGVNPVDRYLALGSVAPEGPLPRTLGVEAAGRVDGAPVVVAAAGLGVVRDGLWSERAVVPHSAVVRVPDGVGLAEASAVPVAGITAYACMVTLGRVQDDDRVLVLGASGGVGLAVLTLATSIGATVYAQTGSPDKEDALRAHGAHEVLAVGAGGLAEAAADLRPTVVVDALGGGFTSAALAVLQPFGRYVVFGTTVDRQVDLDLQSVYRKNVAILGYSVMGQSTQQRREAVVEALAALAAGRMRLPVGRHVPLEQGSAVFEALDDRSQIGKTVLDLG